MRVSSEAKKPTTSEETSIPGESTIETLEVECPKGEKRSWFSGLFGKSGRQEEKGLLDNEVKQEIDAAAIDGEFNAKVQEVGNTIDGFGGGRNPNQVKATGLALLVQIQDQGGKTTDPQQLQRLTNCLNEAITLLNGAGEAHDDGVSCVHEKTQGPSFHQRQSFQQAAKHAPGTLPRWKIVTTGAATTVVGLLVAGVSVASVINTKVEHNTFDHLHLGSNEAVAEWSGVGVGGSTVMAGLSTMYYGFFGGRTGISQAMMEFEQAVCNEQQRGCCGCRPSSPNYSQV